MDDPILSAAGHMFKAGQVLRAYRFLQHAIDRQCLLIREKQQSRLTLDDALFRIRMNDVQKRCGDKPDARAVRELEDVYLSARRAAG